MIASPSPDPDLRLVNHQTQPNVIIIITIKQTKSFRSNFKLTIFINGFPFNRGSYFIRFSLSVPHRIVDCWQEPGPVRGQPRNFSASTSRILMRWLATLLTSPGNQQSPSSRILDSAASIDPWVYKPTRAFSWLKVRTSAFTFKTLLRDFTKH